ncbi:MAG: cytochrome o ubiquinol oxidase subunit IV [Steroidobacteraceae bacterium]
MNVANEAIAGHAPHGSRGAHGVAHGPTQKQYVTGFALAIVLTVIPFALVMDHVVAATALLIAGFALAQILVHVVYFLHVNTSSEQRWNLMALLYTTVMVFIVLGGSLWIMHHLYLNMMPGIMHGSVR